VPLGGTRQSRLGQQHGAGKTVKVHAGSGLDLVGYTSDLGFENFTGIGIGNFVLRGLEFTIRLLACPVLAPVTAVTPGLGFEGHLGKALAGLAGHDFVSTLGDLVQAMASARKERGKWSFEMVVFPAPVGPVMAKMPFKTRRPDASDRFAIRRPVSSDS